MINPTISEWLNLIARWVHVFAGIMWVGTTYYFTWLDARMTEAEKALANTGQAPQIWMVHSGGFYLVEKRKVRSEEHTSELQSRGHLVCRLLLEKKKERHK